MNAGIEVKGLNEFTAALKKVDAEFPKALRLAFNEVADDVVSYAQGRLPRKSGKARASVRASSTSKLVRVSGGSARVPYYPWLDFGGKIGGTNRGRPFLKDGRYIYAGYSRQREAIRDKVEQALIEVGKAAGLEVTGG